MTSTIVGAVNTVKCLAGTNETPPRPTILILLGSYLPGYKAGGPIRSVANIVAAFGGEFDFRVVTLDRDLGDKSPFPGVPANRWVRVGHANVMYLRPGLPGYLGICALLRSADRNTVLYLNSFFNRRFSILAVLMRWLNLCRPRCLVLAPRGEFSLGALQLGYARKRLYIRITQWFGLYEGLIWHASSDFEATDILRRFPWSTSVAIADAIPGLDARTGKRRTSHLVIASDLPGAVVPTRRERPPKMPGQLHAVFVARCSRMKNLSGALMLLAGVSGDVSLVIYGPAEDAGYWGECQGLIAALPPNISVRYEGEIEHERVLTVFAEHDLFLFPTLGENFGHVIAESLLAGCPVLTSDRTPWRNLEALGVGWDVPLSDPKRFREILQQCVDMGSEEHVAMCSRAAAFGADRATDPALIEENRALFRLALAMPTSK